MIDENEQDSVQRQNYFNQVLRYRDELIHSILDSGDKLAILVKRADMKDHFMQTETLTDKLRDKYLPVVGLFL